MNNKINRRTTNIFLKAEELFTELERQATSINTKNNNHVYYYITLTKQQLDYSLE